MDGVLIAAAMQPARHGRAGGLDGYAGHEHLTGRQAVGPGASVSWAGCFCQLGGVLCQLGGVHHIAELEMKVVLLPPVPCTEGVGVEGVNHPHVRAGTERRLLLLLRLLLLRLLLLLQLGSVLPRQGSSAIAREAGSAAIGQCSSRF
jgi:hypothetical protein